jgi:hypothetical protein
VATILNVFEVEEKEIIVVLLLKINRNKRLPVTLI